MDRCGPPRRTDTVEEVLDALARDGFVVLPRALSPESVAALTEATDRVWELRRGAADDSLHELGFVRHDERFVELVDHPLVLPVVLRLLGWNIYLYHCHLDVHPPRLEAPRWRWHQDGGRQNVDVESRRPLFSVKAGWFLTDVTTPEHGALWIIPGSHVHDSLARPADGGFTPPGAEPLLVEAGSLVLFDRRLWHARGDNTSEVVRKALFYAYSYRWVRTRDLSDLPLWPSEQSDPVRRQLLGGAASPLGHWLPTDDEVPLRMR
jgi:ectoine hydroxylase-related dioxygenase (phytanoyl-CoA dioxygenase family)